jgi:hypothetical protein
MASATIEVTVGPTLRTALDVLDLAVDLLELVPEWHEQEREALLARATALQETVLRELKKPPK